MTRFKKGQPSPNPSGRPKGTKSAVKLMRDGLVSLEDLREVVAVLVKKAKEGDSTAATILLDRAVPKIKAVVDDMVAEADLAEALMKARLRAVKSETGRGLTLEELVSSAAGDLPLQAITAEQAPPTLSIEPSVPPAKVGTQAKSAPTPIPAPVRPIRFATDPTTDVDVVYNPLFSIRSNE